MSGTVAFERSHSIVVDAPPGAVLDYVSNPNSWPEWIQASHQITSADRPLVKGDTFREEWHTRTGGVELNWTVTDSAPARLWIGEADTTFIGKIVVRYDVEPVEGGARFTRTVCNPVRPKPPTEDMVRRIDEEAAVCLANIKRNVEARG
ncbi:MAG: SRPBCC family protein [Alphaproteobacteria bacterium]|nr:SRPBCC family protein [Alphaproteobacteria bacterium]MCB9928034.1 SRPBCC family protein [Alphaproteobacteria bacterium]